MVMLLAWASNILQIHYLKVLKLCHPCHFHVVCLFDLYIRLKCFRHTKRFCLWQIKILSSIFNLKYLIQKSHIFPCHNWMVRRISKLLYPCTTCSLVDKCTNQINKVHINKYRAWVSKTLIITVKISEWLTRYSMCMCYAHIRKDYVCSLRSETSTQA